MLNELVNLFSGFAYQPLATEQYIWENTKVISLKSIFLSTYSFIESDSDDDEDDSKKAKTVPGANLPMPPMMPPMMGMPGMPMPFPGMHPMSGMPLPPGMPPPPGR